MQSNLISCDCVSYTFRIGLDWRSSTVWNNSNIQTLCTTRLMRQDFMSTVIQFSLHDKWSYVSTQRLESIYSKPRSKAWNPDVIRIFECPAAGDSVPWNSRRGTERSCLLLQSELSQMPYGGVCLSCAVFCGVVFFGQFGVGWVWKHCIVEDMRRTGHKRCAEPSRTNDWRLQLGPRLRGSN